MKYLILCFLLSLSGILLCQADGDNTLNLNEGWDYEIILTNEGTRSEGRKGILSYEGESIGFYFHTVIIGTYTFVYRQAVNLWDDDGYFPVADSVKEQTFGETEREKGWYAVPSPPRVMNSRRKKNTPEDWICVRRGEKIFFVAPDSIKRLIDELNFKPLNSEMSTREY